MTPILKNALASLVLLELYQASLEARWLEEALNLQTMQDPRF